MEAVCARRRRHKISKKSNTILTIGSHKRVTTEDIDKNYPLVVDQRNRRQRNTRNTKTPTAHNTQGSMATVDDLPRYTVYIILNGSSPSTGKPCVPRELRYSTVAVSSA
jgi:hypothetical protein